MWVDKDTEAVGNVKKLRKNGFKVKNIMGGVFDLDPWEAGKRNVLHTSDHQKKFFDVSYLLGVKVDLLKYQILKEIWWSSERPQFVYKRLPSNEELKNNDLILYKFDHTADRAANFENCFMSSAPTITFIKYV